MTPEEHRNARIERINRELYQELQKADSRNVSTQCREDIVVDVAEHWARMGWESVITSTGMASGWREITLRGL